MILTLKTKLRVELDSMNYRYDLSHYILDMKSFSDINKCITWNRIECINEIVDDKKRAQFIGRNLIKLIWDILHAIEGFHACGYVHNDCRIDNIGYYKNYFVLFDYNLSAPKRNIQKDTDSFVRSIRFHTNGHIVLSSDQEKLLRICHDSPSPLDEFIYAFQILRGVPGKPESFTATTNYLNSLTIE
jgi:hypothetical protein